MNEQFKALSQRMDEECAQAMRLFEPYQAPGLTELVASMSYSLSSGGKRFRPVLSMLTAQALQAPLERVLPWALSVEMIHTYSLIHDDLPCMDNDDLRRGLPTNHKKFGEATALLAGDALLTEAFYTVADRYGEEPGLAATLLKLLAHAAGVRGMVGGQSIDMTAKGHDLTLAQLTRMHQMKTGALISVAVEGAAWIAGADADSLKRLTTFAERLGLAFQVADDLLDSSESVCEPGSFPALLGMEPTRQYLKNLTREALQELEDLGPQAEALRTIAHYNAGRTL